MEPLEILYQDTSLIAVNKPNGLLVHKTPIASDANEFALQIVRNQIGKRVYPLHRLDRKTSGVLLFCTDKSLVDVFSVLFRDRKIKKVYHAIVRGFTEEHGTVDYALKNAKNKIQNALTEYRKIEKFELDIPFGKHVSSRYSMLELIPQTGRMHQLRKHMAHIFHPIIGDRPHGCNKQNRLWKERWNMEDMLLHASEIHFEHPLSKEKVVIRAGYQESFLRALDILRGGSQRQDFGC